jgi:signal transduction histidine kinase
MKASKSLKTTLVRNLLVTLCLGWAITLLAGYFITESTLNRELDAQLKQMEQSLSDNFMVDQTTIETSRREIISAGEKPMVEFQIWRDDKMIRYSAAAPQATLAQHEGYSQNEIGDKKWRVFSAQKDHSRIMVAQDLKVRNALVHGMILSSFWPMVFALPIIALILWWSVGFSLKPLLSITSAIQERSDRELSGIELNEVPTEMMPVVHSLNHLLDVVAQALDREKQFAENAAHELRTPLAGMKAQVEAALLSDDTRERTESLFAINQGIDRASRMVTQLLALARLEPNDLQANFKPIDLTQLVSQVIAKFTTSALAKEIDLGLDTHESVFISGEASYLEMMIGNMIDNAIRYSPSSSKVDVSIEKNTSHVQLNIEDQGPGIPAPERKKVFDRFVRLPGNMADGSGIGLTVVKKIADLHQGTILLSNGANQNGLKISVIFPNPSAHT